MKIAFVSAKGGVGKTTLSVNLASYIKRYYNKRVLLIDLNKYNHSSEIFVENGKRFGDRLWQGIIITKYFHIKFLERLPDNFYNDIAILEKIYNYIIFDVPPDFELILKISEVSDIIFLVINSDLFSIYSNYYLYKNLPKEKVKIILNKYDKSIDIEFIEKIFNKEISAVIEYNKDIAESNNLLIPLPFYKEKGSAIKRIDELSSLITGERKKISLIEKIFNILG